MEAREMQRLEHSLAAPKWPDSKPGFSVYTLVDFVVGYLPRGFPPVLGFPCLKIQNFKISIRYEKYNYVLNEFLRAPQAFYGLNTYSFHGD